MDLVFEDFLDEAGQIEGVCGASRLVCKTFWDYKMILRRGPRQHRELHGEPQRRDQRGVPPRIQALAVGEVKQQNFVYDDIE